MEHKLELTRRNFVIGAGALMAAGALGVTGCSPEGSAGTEEAEAENAEAEEAAAAEEAPAEEEVDNTVTFDEVDIEAATADEVAAAIGGNGTLLVDARPWEAYAGWAMEGAANGGHLKGALLYSKRWIDMEYGGRTPRAVYLEREMNDQGITSDATVIVYDYTGEQATTVAQYFIAQGVKNVKAFQANELIDAGTDLVSYEQHRMFLPAEIVKSVSDVKTGKESELTDAAKEIIGDRIDNVVLIDVSWGSAWTSAYFSEGHVPGSVHINSDSYERPRVYVPEQRSEYAKEWRKIPLEEFRDSVCTEYGITKDSICILSSSSTSPHARLGMYLNALGCEVYVMAGALNAWKYNGYELDTDPSTMVIPEAVESFGSDKIDDQEWHTADIMAIQAGEKEGQIVDNRGEDEWLGEYSGYSYHDLAGQIEGSIWCCQGSEEAGEYFDNADGTPRTTEEAVAYLESAGLDTSIPMVFFCGDSWGATHIAYWCNSIDLPNVKTWTEGWIPWSNEGHEFIDNEGRKVHYDKWLDTVVDEDGNDVRNGMNSLDIEVPES